MLKSGADTTRTSKSKANSSTKRLKIAVEAVRSLEKELDGRYDNEDAMTTTNCAVTSCACS